MSGRARTWTCVCAPPSRARLLSNQRREWPHGPRGSAAVGEGHVCTHCGPSCARAVVKSVADGPFWEASSEKLRNTASVRGRALKAHLSPFWGVLKRKESRSARLPNERSEKCQWKCSIRTRCHHRSAVEPNHCFSGEFPLLKPSPLRCFCCRWKSWCFASACWRICAAGTAESWWKSVTATRALSRAVKCDGDRS